MLKSRCPYSTVAIAAFLLATLVWLGVLPATAGPCPTVDCGVELNVDESGS